MVKRSAFILTLLIFAHFSGLRAQGLTQETFKIGKTLALLEAIYVDSVDISDIAEQMIIATLRNLDPHSVYIPAEDVQEQNEPLQGNFEGIGIQFNVLNDTIIIISPIPGGPSERVGILAGDRIVAIAGEKVTGVGISTTGVQKRLRGAKGTTVDVAIFRKGEKELLDFTITRDKIPVNSLDAAYMLSANTGYIKLSRFSDQTALEFDQAVARLLPAGMKNLIVDLRGNSGGYMVPAVQIADEMLPEEELIVYLEGLHTSRQEYRSAPSGTLTGARIAVLIDEGSASASEILAGAIQDWDRGIVIGRRSFGKGLVQNGFSLPDGSEIRLTIARYYTPSGRSIQTPYNEGFDKYFQTFYSRYFNGELIHADSLGLPDSLKAYTITNKRIVYGGGGITPDVFIPIDTTYYSDYYRDMIRTSTILTFMVGYTDSNRKSLLRRYRTFDRFNDEFTFDAETIEALKAAGEKNGVKFDGVQYDISAPEMLRVMKGLVARDLWDMNEYYMVVNREDHAIDKALSILNDPALYGRFLGYRREVQ
ncbi:MAG: S41 family peptidase [Bacteroidales bacterium]|nr:S41 family peptidase [Bacteroidales bacterium]MDT8372736.1 S41 family peptidase [Bacteroidales bacterium]